MAFERGVLAVDDCGFAKAGSWAMPRCCVCVLRWPASCAAMAEVFIWLVIEGEDALERCGGAQVSGRDSKQYWHMAYGLHSAASFASLPCTHTLCCTS